MTTNDQLGEGDLSRRIRRRRGALGLTREEVAGQACMDPRGLARAEQAPVTLTAGALIRLADALDTTVPDATTAIGRYGEGPVAFEVDRTDQAMQEGWSVLVSGIARHAGHGETAALRTTLAGAPWANGDRELYVVITPSLITGRRIRAW